MKQFYQEWKNLSVKKTLFGKEALEAVKRNGDFLKYVKEEIFIKNTICVEANGKAVSIFKESAECLGLI